MSSTSSSRSSFSLSSSSSPFFSFSSLSCHQFSLDQIKKATNNFDAKKVLGHGGEATVYLAEVYLNSKTEKTRVAVKHLSKDSAEFDKEIQIVTKIQHPHLVSLLGYCNEFDEKILIYEYMEKGSLLDYVKKDSCVCLSWKQRLKICLGAAYGLQHLHKKTDEFRKGIIHRDVKPANILLNDNWDAKVSDFGMFKLSNSAQINSTVITGILKGTQGYFAPEYVLSRHITRKIDVYAFGVVLFEVLCRKKPWDRGDMSYYLEENEDLGVWAQENVDSEIKTDISDDSLKVFANTIGRCLQPDPNKRPTMDEVVLALKTAVKHQVDEDDVILSIHLEAPRLFQNGLSDGLLQVVDGVYVFESCLSTEVLSEKLYQFNLHKIITKLLEGSPESSFLAFNFRESEKRSLFTKILWEYDLTVTEYPRQYEGCPLLSLSSVINFLQVCETWLIPGHSRNVILLHCERGGWPLLAFLLASFLVKKLQRGERKSLEIVYREAPKGLVHLLSPLNPFPSQLRYLQYISRRNISPAWPPPERELSLDCLILRSIPCFDNQNGCRPIIRIFGRNLLSTDGLSTQMLYSMPKRGKSLRHYSQEDCDIIKIDIQCLVKGDVVLECVHLDLESEREVMMFRVMFNTSLIRSNILMLNRDDLDILWESKGQYHKSFRAEILFGEVESIYHSQAPTAILSGKEKGGLPLDAFSRVHELFNGVELSDSNDDAAAWLLKQLSVLNDVKEKPMLQSRLSTPSSPFDSEEENNASSIADQNYPSYGASEHQHDTNLLNSANQTPEETVASKFSTSYPPSQGPLPPTAVPFASPTPPPPPLPSLPFFSSNFREASTSSPSLYSSGGPSASPSPQASPSSSFTNSNREPPLPPPLPPPQPSPSLSSSPISSTPTPPPLPPPPPPIYSTPIHPPYSSKVPSPTLPISATSTKPNLSASPPPPPPPPPLLLTSASSASATKKPSLPPPSPFDQQTYVSRSSPPPPPPPPPARRAA